MVKNTVAPGLIIGAAKVRKSQPNKSYAYVEHPSEGWRVYLRSAVFIHDASQPFDPAKFIVVKKYGANSKGKSWEPPKGQMEGKDTKGCDDILKLLEMNAQREVVEESKITTLVNLKHTGLVYEGREHDYAPNTLFQYHIFQAFVEPAVLAEASNEFKWLHEHQAEWDAMKPDKREKDALGWYRGADTKMFGRWSDSIVKLYLANIR
jgi:hypothetical protein